MRSRILALILSLSVLACTDVPKTGPLPVKWDRHQCSECGMAVSDRRFATQIRGGPDREQSSFVFDDIGCAIRFSKKQKWMSEPTTEIWVQDYSTQKWLDARKAHFVKVKSSPMNYGYAAHEDEKTEQVDFLVLDKKIGEDL